MDKNEIDSVMKKSKSAQKNDSPWIAFYDEMAKKTVIRRLFKKLPQEKLDIDTISALRDEDYFDRAECETDDNCIKVQKNDYANKSESVAEII
jgi:recombinational DNA repair protein RecT